MKSKFLHPGGFELAALKTVLLIFMCAVCSAQMPDVTGGTQGWRYATPEDTAYWDNVSVDDVLMFGTIDAGTNRRVIRQNATNGPIEIQGGKKIHIWQGEYAMIRLEYYRWIPQPTEADPNAGRWGGSFVETNSSEANPVTITNLGGQVQFGAFGNWGHSMHVFGLKHVLVTGEYDPQAGTGHVNYKGMNGNLTSHGWINQFGIMGDRKYSTMQTGNPYEAGAGLTINRFLSAKVRGVAVLRGFWAGFSIKSDDTTLSHHSNIDVQRCLSGWHTNEGFYIGSTQGVNANPDNKVVFKDNVVLFTGGDGLQLDKLSSGTEIMNNFMYKAACFYQYPHETGFRHDNTLQLSFVQGDVHTEDNILYGGTAGKILNNFVLIPKSGVSVQPSEITLSNNLFGPSRARFGFIASSDSADSNGDVTFRIENNFIDFMPVVCSNDVETPIRQFTEWIRIDSRKSPYYLTNNIFPEGDKDLYNSSATTVDTSNITFGPIPPLLLHNNFGFDPAEILKFRGVWLTGEYGTTADSEGPITYNEGDMVFTVKDNKTRYYRCIQTHSVANDPSTQTAYWQQMTWDGQDEPTYTPLLQSGSVYNTRGMGLTYNPPPLLGSCDSTGQITREYWANVVGYNVSDIPLSSPPTSTSQLTSFQGPSNQADNYGARIRGYVCPPTTGNYIFWIASDDKSELWLSTDAEPANKRQIASVTVWTNPDEWTKYSTQQSAPISLVAGQKYYVEALHKEISGTDHIAVGWTLPDGTLERPIPGKRLLPFTEDGSSEPRTTWNSYNMTISSNPAEQGVILSDQGTKAVVEFYESTDDFGVTKGSLFSAHDPDNHPHLSSHATNWWKVSATSGNYPFAGLSTVGRGDDTGETNAPEPLGAIDLQLHPPINDKLAVAAFIVPKAGTYEVSKLGARRVSADPSTGGTIRFQVFDKNKIKKADIVATNNQLWATNSNIIVLENLAVNDRIYFATSRDGSYAYDFTEVTWTVTLVPPESGTAARTASNLENDLITAISEEESRAVYPNPVENIMHVKGLPGNETTVKIYNTRGMLMMQQNISGDQSGTTLELGNYTPGIYFIVLQSGREIRRYKFLKK